MSGRRVLALYGALLLGFAAVVCRLYWLCSNTDYAVRAAAQSEAVLRLPAARGNFYDCNGLPLTGISQRWLALCFPGEDSYAALPLCGRRRAGQALPGAEYFPALSAGRGAGCKRAGRAVLCRSPAVRRCPAGRTAHWLSGQRGPRRSGP